MSESFDRIPDALIAVGLGANKGFWMIQPRDDEGQWIEMGAHVIFRFRTGKGNLVVATQHGVYVGPSGKPGFARVLIPKDTPEGLKAGVYDIESRNLQQFKAIIPGLDGKSSRTRLDKFGKPVQTLEDAKLPALDDLLKTARAITPQDERLAKGDLTPEEKSAEAKARLESPLADKPAGFENDNPEEAAKLLEAAGADIKSATIKPEAKTEADRSPVDEVLADVAYNGDTKKTVDDLIDESLALERRKSATEEPTSMIDIGDLIIAPNGDELSVTDIKHAEDPATTHLVVQRASDGRVFNFIKPLAEKHKVIRRGGQSKRPQRPAAPTRTPANADQINKLMDLESKGISDPKIAKEVEAILGHRGDVADLDGKKVDDLISRVQKDQTSDVAPTDTNIGEGGSEFDGASDVPAAPGLQPANFPPKDRLDDGSEFELPTLTNEQIDEARNRQLTPLLDPDGTPAKFVDENNNVVDAEDPFAMMAVLAKIYPNAKFTEDGALVLHRQKDKDGRIFELRANNSGKKAIVYSMRWTDPNTGEYTEYQHKDDRHSIKALLRKDNGPQDLLDRLLGRTDNKGKSWATLKFGNSSWGPSDSLFKRLRWFMSGTGDRKKMESLGDNAIRLADGRAAVYHKDGTVKNSEIPSLWDSFNEFITSGSNNDDRDAEARDNLYQTLYSVFGRAPLNEKAHAAYRSALRKEFKRKFPTASATEVRAFGGFVTNASERMRGIYREPDANVRSIRYASKDRTRAIERGQTVEYTNNVGETSIVKVSNLIENVNATPQGGSYDYGDYVIVTDANGKQVKVNALKLKILRDQGTSLSAFKSNLRGEALRQRRIELGQWLPEAPRGSNGDSNTRPRQPRSSAYDIPGQGSVVSDPAPEPKVIDDFVQGEMLYNKEGKPLGIIKAVRPVTGRSGAPGLAFLYQRADGTEGQATYALGTEIKPKKAQAPNRGLLC